MSPVAHESPARKGRLTDKQSVAAYHWHAHGMDIACDFRLPGLSMDDGSDTAEAPKLTIHMCREAEFWQQAGRPAGAPQWSGLQGDGTTLSLWHDANGDALFAYGEKTWFQLHSQMSRLNCLVRDTGSGWKRVLLGKVIPAASVLRGFEALHAAAVDSPWGVVGILAPSGIGKSTLASALIARGWRLFADDQLTLSRQGETLLAHRGTGHANLAPTLDTTMPRRVLASIGGEDWSVLPLSPSRARSVRLLCLLERSQGLTQGCVEIAGSPLPLSPYILGLNEGPERMRRRFLLYAQLTSEVPVVRLTASPADSPDELAQLVERRAAEPEDEGC